MGTDENLFRLRAMVGHGAQVLPPELVAVPRHGAQICGQAATKGYVQTGPCAGALAPSLNGTLLSICNVLELSFFTDHRRPEHACCLTRAWELQPNCLHSLRHLELVFHGNRCRVFLHQMKTSTWAGCSSCFWRSVQFMAL